VDNMCEDHVEKFVIVDRNYVESCDKPSEEAEVIEMLENVLARNTIEDNVEMNTTSLEEARRIVKKEDAAETQEDQDDRKLAEGMQDDPEDRMHGGEQHHGRGVVREDHHEAGHQNLDGGG
jgi:hypothetical protein